MAATPEKKSASTKICCIDGCNAVLPHPHQYYCAEHKKQRQNEVQREYRIRTTSKVKETARLGGHKKKPAVKPKLATPISEIVRQARECGMSYGRFMAVNG